MSTEPRIYKVDRVTRLEGEGRFYVRVQDGRVTETKLDIFEAPRFFEAFLCGRSLFEVPDFAARVCGICHAAHQICAAQAVEQAIGLQVGGALRALRRLLACGEWIASHALHIYLLQAPDLLGFPSGLEMAQEHQEVVERGLSLKRAGNEILELLGGRAVHPVSVRIGGFSKIPTRAQLITLRDRLAARLEDAVETVRWVSRLPLPAFKREYVFVSLGSESYPVDGGGSLLVSGIGEYPVESFEVIFEETQVAHSTALHCKLVGGTSYMVGPLARLNLNANKLHPQAALALREAGIDLPLKNPYAAIIARAVELVHVLAEAVDLLDTLEPPAAPFVKAAPRAGEGHSAVEAPRGLLFHRYRIRASGKIDQARIVPPTSQNLACIEKDLTSLVSSRLEEDPAQVIPSLEAVIRSYDPCLSCSTHALRLALNIDRR